MSKWRADLAACGRRTTIGQAIIAWFANPGFALACHYRLAHWASGTGKGTVKTLIERRMLHLFGCQISGEALIGAGLRLPHPLGIVIGAGSVIGENCTVYHGVTLGRRSTQAGEYPVLGDGVTLYCGATLLGAVVIGDGERVVAGAMLIGDPVRMVRVSAQAVKQPSA